MTATAGGEATIGRRATDRLLTDVAADRADHRQLVATLVGPGGRAFAASAAAHGLAGEVLAAIGPDEDLPGEVVADLQHARDFAVQTHLRAVLDLGVVADALDAADVPWLVVKGIVIAETLYPTVDQRPFGDLDLLVSPRRFGAALEALEAAGATVLDRNWKLFSEQLPGQLHLQLPFGSVCDLHWDLVHHHDVRLAFRLPADELLERAVPVVVAGREVWTTDDEDTLVHLSTHACTSGLTRLAWTRDIDRIVRQRPLDWDAVVELATRTGTRLSVAVALTAARELLDTPVPRHALRRLDPAGVWRRLARATVRRRNPNGAGLTPAVLLARSTRDTGARSLVELLQRAAGAAGERRAGVRPPTGAEVVLLPDGGPDDRRRYLEAVEAVGHLPL